MIRFDYARFRKRDAAERALEDFYATGEVGDGDHPAIKRRTVNGTVWFVVEIDG